MNYLGNSCAYSLRAAVPGLLIIGLSACGGTSPPEVERTGFALHFPELAGTDAVGVRVTATRTACDPSDYFDASAVSEYPFLISSSLEGFPNYANPMASSSTHRFADVFMMLPVGCYDIYAQPANFDGGPSGDCLAAWATDQRVTEGQVADVFLLVQCRGEATGAIDVTTVFNRAPSLVHLQYVHSKFVRACERVQICATATDPDGDPLTFRWSVMAGPATFTVVSDAVNGSSASECIELVPPVEGTYRFQVTVYDMMEANDGTLVRVEDWLSSQGYGSQSQDEQNFPLYVAQCLPQGP